MSQQNTSGACIVMLHSHKRDTIVLFGGLGEQSLLHSEFFQAIWMCCADVSGDALCFITIKILFVRTMNRVMIVYHYSVHACVHVFSLSRNNAEGSA